MKAKADKSITEFCHKHKDKLVIVADPKTDALLVSYMDYRTMGRIKSADGKRFKVIRDVLKPAGIYKPKVKDRFLGGLVDSLKLGIGDGQEFYKYVLFGIKAVTDRMNYDKKQKVESIKRSREVSRKLRAAHK